MRSGWLVLAALLWACGLHGQTESYASPQALAEHLRSLGRSLTVDNAENVAAALPSFWNVRAGTRTFTISTGTLRALLLARAPKVNRSWPKIADAQAWLSASATEAESYGQAQVAEGSQKALKRILAEPEFSSQPESETAWDRWKRQVVEWVGRMLERLLGSALAKPGTRNLLFWGALLGALGAIAYVLVRLWTKSPATAPWLAREKTVFDRTSEVWARAAREAALAGDLRHGIQCAYWAGIAHLQEISVLPPDKGRTPREYLRALRLEPDRSEPVQILTSQLERFWYASLAPSEEDFALCLHSLDVLGCKQA